MVRALSAEVRTTISMALIEHNVRQTTDKNGVTRKAHTSHHRAGENIDLAAVGGGVNRRKPEGWTGLPQPATQRVDEPSSDFQERHENAVGDIVLGRSEEDDQAFLARVVEKAETGEPMTQVENVVYRNFREYFGDSFPERQPLSSERADEIASELGALAPSDIEIYSVRGEDESQVAATGWGHVVEVNLEDYAEEPQYAMEAALVELVEHSIIDRAQFVGIAATPASYGNEWWTTYTLESNGRTHLLTVDRADPDQVREELDLVLANFDAD
jgi:hypothetical protein